MLHHKPIFFVVATRQECILFLSFPFEAASYIFKDYHHFSFKPFPSPPLCTSGSCSLFIFRLNKPNYFSLFWYLVFCRCLIIPVYLLWTVSNLIHMIFWSVVPKTGHYTSAVSILVLLLLSRMEKFLFLIMLLPFICLSNIWLFF